MNASGGTTREASAEAHRPVMVREVLRALEPRDGAIYLDGTFGAGGTTQALLAAADCRVWAIDRVPEAVRRGETLAPRFQNRLTVIEGRFGDMDALVMARDLETVDGITLDLGVSSPQLDRPERGFSFREEGPLDMRMSGPDSDDGPTAAEVVNTYPEAEIADILWRFGEERRSRAIARAIVARRKDAPFATTTQLADLVRAILRRVPGGTDPATRTFQALRIFVNDELGELDRGLQAAETLLCPGGRLAVIAFHSLEDRKVKDFLRARSARGGGGSRHRPAKPDDAAPAASFSLLFKGALKPQEDEIRINPRARSARLRAAVRTDAPAWPHGPQSNQRGRRR